MINAAGMLVMMGIEEVAVHNEQEKVRFELPDIAKVVLVLGTLVLLYMLVPRLNEAGIA